MSSFTIRAALMGLVVLALALANWAGGGTRAGEVGVGLAIRDTFVQTSRPQDS